jgi:hypothetical protein
MPYRYRISVALLKEPLPAQWTPITDQRGLPVIPYIEVDAADLPDLQARAKKPAEPWYLVATEHPELLQVVTRWTDVPYHRARLREAVEFYDVPETLQELLKPTLHNFYQTTGLLVKCVGPGQGWQQHNPEIFFLQLAPQVSQPLNRTLLGIPVQAPAPQALSGFQPVQLNGHPEALLQDHSLYLLFQTENLEDYYYLIVQTLWSYMWKYKPELADTFLKNCQETFARAYQQTLPKFLTARTRHLELLSLAEDAELRQKLAELETLLQAQQQRLQRYCTARQQASNGDQLTRDGRQLVNLLSLRTAQFRDHRIEVITDPIWTAVGEEMAAIGSYRIQLDLKAGTEEYPIQISRIQGDLEGWDHPHFRYGIPLDPTFIQTVQDLLGNLQYSKALQQTFLALYQYNPETAGIPLERFALGEG